MLLQHVASRNETVVDKTRQSRDNSVDDYNDDTGQSVDSLSKCALPSYDPNIRLSASLGHLQLECVPEHLEEEVEYMAGEVNQGDESGIPAAAAAAAQQSPPGDGAVSSDDGLQQHGTEEHVSADMALHVDSKPLLSFELLSANNQKIVFSNLTFKHFWAFLLI